MGDYLAMSEEEEEGVLNETGVVMKTLTSSSVEEALLCVALTVTVIVFSCYCLFIFLLSPRHIRANFKNPAGFIMTWLSLIDFTSAFLLLLPMSTTVALGHEWVFGRAFCVIQGLVLQLVQNMANTLLMSAAIDRFCALVMPIRYIYLMSEVSNKIYGLFSLFVLVYSSVFPVCSAILYGQTHFDGQLLCFIYSQSVLFTSFNFVINAGIPLFIMVAAYSAIIVSLCKTKTKAPPPTRTRRDSNRNSNSNPSHNSCRLKGNVQFEMTGLVSNSTEARGSTVSSMQISGTEPGLGRKHVSDSKENEEKKLIQRAYNLFLAITVIFILTWMPYMTVDFFYGGQPAPSIIYKLTTYLIFTISLSNLPLFVAYNRSFRSAFIQYTRLIFCRQRSIQNPNRFPSQRATNHVAVNSSRHLSRSSVTKQVQVSGTFNTNGTSSSRVCGSCEEASVNLVRFGGRGGDVAKPTFVNCNQTTSDQLKIHLEKSV